MRIATPYLLPFRAMVQEPPLLLGGSAVIVTAYLDGLLTDQAISILNGFLDAFWTLAVAGAVGGDSLRPWRSTVADKSDPQEGSGVVSWTLEGCDLDERAVVNLIHLLLAANESTKIREVSIRRLHGAGPLQPLAENPDIENPYPPRWPEARFKEWTSNAFVTDSRRVSMEFSRELTPKEVSDIKTHLLGWSVAAAVGAYAVAPISPMSTYLEPDTEVEVFGTELTWHVHRMRLHPAAIDGLVNVCIAFDRTIAPIIALLID